VFEFGTIALARFPFTDLSGDKSRPVLIVSRDNDRRVDVVVRFITSVPRVGLLPQYHVWVRTLPSLTPRLALA
jgi:hypothetical protein